MADEIICSVCNKHAGHKWFECTICDKPVCYINDCRRRICMDFDVCKSCYKKRKPYEKEMNQIWFDMIDQKNKVIEKWKETALL